MRQRYIQCPTTHKLIPAEEWADRSEPSAPMVMPDIQGYRSTVTGEWIGSRSTHRAHLKEHRLVEVGNEKMKPRQQQIDRQGIRQAAEMAVRRVLG